MISLSPLPLRVFSLICIFRMRTLASPLLSGKGEHSKSKNDIVFSCRPDKHRHLAERCLAFFLLIFVVPKLVVLILIFVFQTSNQRQLYLEHEVWKAAPFQMIIFAILLAFLVWAYPLEYRIYFDGSLVVVRCFQNSVFQQIESAQQNPTCSKVRSYPLSSVTTARNLVVVKFGSGLEVLVLPDDVSAFLNAVEKVVASNANGSLTGETPSQV